MGAGYSEYSGLEYGSHNAYPRGETRVGFKGWVAWIDDGSRDVHTAQGKCNQVHGGKCYIGTDDGEYSLEVPHGRLQHSRNAAIDSLIADIREEGERQMKGIEQRQQALERERADIARGMLLHLVACEMAKARGGDVQAGKNLGEEIKRLEF
jgi:hypothetical protein